jgi:acetyltransferase-like isoleucine patch superfamily enzyme
MWVTSTVFNREKLRLGTNSAWSQGCIFNCDGGLSIGNNVLIGPHVCIHTTNHNYSNPKIPICRQGNTPEPVIIHDDVWIGANAVVLPGVTVGKGSVIGAGSIVTKSIPPYSVAVGNPARVVKRRGENMNLEQIMLKYSVEDYVFSPCTCDTYPHSPNCVSQKQKRQEVKIKQ